MLIHASCVRWQDKGILLMGSSGAGKSSAALMLMEKGAVLIADDYVQIKQKDGQLFAKCPDTIFQKLEVRGIGIVTLKNAIQQTPLDLVIACTPDFAAVPRMPEHQAWKAFDTSLPLFRLCPFENTFPSKVGLAIAGL